MPLARTAHLIALAVCAIHITVSSSHSNNGLIVSEHSHIDEVNEYESSTVRPDHQKSNEIGTGDFVATADWQEIKKGQNIPSGLHVRIDLESGKKEAKLLDKAAESRASLRKNTYNSLEDREKMMALQIEQALKDIDKPGFDKDVVSKRSNARSYDELKREFNELKLSVKTDLEIMTSLLSNYRSLSADQIDKKIDILAEIEDLVHQYDNAVNFFGSVDLGGLAIVQKALNCSDERMRLAAASIVGSAAQNNAKVKLILLEAGILRTFLVMLSQDQVNSVRLKLLYALSSLLHNFPRAQHEFLTLGGADLLVRLMSNHSDQKQPIRIISILNHILYRNGDASKSNLIGRPNKLSPAFDYLKALDVCDKAASLSIEPKLWDYGSSVDDQETLLRFLDSLTRLNLCPRRHFKLFRDVISKKRRRLALELADDPDADYLKPLLIHCDNILERVNGARDEL